jgi:putative acetyltransferase
MILPVIRPELPTDHRAIGEVHEQAFSRSNEAHLVEAIRASPGFIPELSLVAERQGAIVGHVMFSTVALENQAGCVSVLALAPLAVRPEWQRQGLGSRLVRAGLERAAALGHLAVILIGHPSYYPRFGFIPARAFGIEPPMPLPNEVFMVLPLQADNLDGVCGTLIYPLAFDEV